MTQHQQIGADLSEVMKLVGLLYRRSIRSLERDGTHPPMGTRAVLELLLETPPQPVPSISETLLLSRQFVQRSVNAGITSGLLEFVDNPKHRRSKLVRPTAAGHDLMNNIIEREQRLLASGAAHLTADQTATCLHVLRTVYDQTEWTPQT